jgi:transcriptional regulator with XRE-family HTH domain
MTALLRAVRRQRGLTLESLAALTGLTKSYLSKIERRRSTPSIATAMKVARALDVDVAQLFSEQSDEEKIAIDRAADRGADRQRYRAMAAGLLGKSMSPFVVRPTGRSAGDPPPAHTGQEFVFVHAGTVELEYGERTVRLTDGDSAYFDASVSHRIRAVGTARAEVVVVAADEPGSRR